MSPGTHVVWGPELSPFLLKLESLLVRSKVPFRRLPRDGGRLESLRAARRVATAKRSRTALRPPGLDPLDEYPLVPFLLTPEGGVLYDSSALAGWLDERHPAPAGPSVPEEPAARFVTQVIDEAFDEIGLYLVHHNRWVVAARDNGAGARLAAEYRTLLPPGIGGLFAAWFARRQVRRLPYLFSVAPAGFAVDGLRTSLTPPARPGFPPTHALLGEIWGRWVDGVEHALAGGPYLLGDRPSLADASVYGQLSMNLTDPSAARALRARGPHTYDWLCAIRDGRHAGARGRLTLDARLAPLLRAILDVFPPIMTANARAHAEAVGRGERRFNEPAFDRGRALYRGTVLGHPFRSVVKTFQVRVWCEVCAAWAALPADARGRIASLVGGGRDLDPTFALR
jgi:glutathione S-transferase